jgi:hypothetical protein
MAVAILLDAWLLYIFFSRRGAAKATLAHA